MLLKPYDRWASSGRHLYWLVLCTRGDQGRSTPLSNACATLLAADKAGRAFFPEGGDALGPVLGPTGNGLMTRLHVEDVL
jgi:hypothetical protein